MNKVFSVLLVALIAAGCQQEKAVDTSAEVEQQASAEQAPAVSEAPPSSEAPDLVCFLDEVDGAVSQPTTEVGVGAMTKLRGWIGFLNGEGIAPQVFELKLVSPEQSYSFKQAAGALRQDVADSQAKPGLANAGYEFILSFADIAPGTYEVTMSAANNGVEGTCTTGKTVTVK